VIRSIGENMALNNGAYAMSGESIKAFDRSCLPMTGSWVVYIADCCA
jgi:hypothetical protein